MGMKKGQNFNHPKRGSVISVDPIRRPEDIKLIKNQLSDSPTESALFVVGINTNLRPVDLSNLKTDMIRLPGNRTAGSVTIREQKTQKKRIVILNKVCVFVIEKMLRWRCSIEIKSQYLFCGSNGGKLSSPNITALVKGWCLKAQLGGNYGGHTLRKTWGYHQYRRFNASLPDLMKCYNHSSQKQTLDYLCIVDEDIKRLFSNEI